MNSSPVRGFTNRASFRSASTLVSTAWYSSSPHSTGLSSSKRSTTLSLPRASVTTTLAIACSAAEALGWLVWCADVGGGSFTDWFFRPAASFDGFGFGRCVGRFFVVTGEASGAVDTPPFVGPPVLPATSDSPIAHCHCARETRSSAPKGGTIALPRSDETEVGTFDAISAAGPTGAPPASKTSPSSTGAP